MGRCWGTRVHFRLPDLRLDLDVEGLEEVIRRPTQQDNALHRGSPTGETSISTTERRLPLGVRGSLWTSFCVDFYCSPTEPCSVWYSEENNRTQWERGRPSQFFLKRSGWVLGSGGFLPKGVRNSKKSPTRDPEGNHHLLQDGDGDPEGTCYDPKWLSDRNRRWES